MKTMRKLLLLLVFSTFCSNCQTQPGVLTLSGGVIAPVGDNPGIGRTTSSSGPNGTELTNAMLSGTVVDAQSQKPVQGATVFHNGAVMHTSSDGRFELKEVDRNKPVLIKASGYRQTSVSVSDS